MAQIDLTDLPHDLWRVHKAQYGPLNPPPRSGTPDQSWSRFDIPGWAVLYAASVQTQWAELGHMVAGQVARQWRDVRELSSFHRHIGLEAPVVDLASAGTIAHLRETVGHWAPPQIQRDPPPGRSLPPYRQRPQTDQPDRLVTLTHYASHRGPAHWVTVPIQARN